MNGENTNKVVEIRDVGAGIVQFKMQDKVSKNTYSEQLVNELIDAFEGIKSRNDCKVVILTGYDSYFCSGGQPAERHFPGNRAAISLTRQK